MNPEMESHSIPTKRPRFSIEESAVEQQQLAEMEASLQKRSLCNELVYELGKEIPIVNTPKRILLTAHKMYAYLEPRFRKNLIYRGAIAFLKALLNANKNIEIRIDEVAQNKESEQIVVVRRKQWDYYYMDWINYFKLDTNQFRVHIETRSYPPIEQCTTISINSNQLENVHLIYFLRLIVPLMQPIQFCFHYYSSKNISIDVLVHFLDTQSDWIDSIALWDRHFDSKPIYKALNKCNKLKIYGSQIRPVNVPKLIQWLTDNNPSEKCLFLGQERLNDGLALLIEEVKKEFAGATNTNRFVVRLKLRQHLDEFTLRNELTGENLELRRKEIKYGRYIHKLSRFPSNEMDAKENDCEELDTSMTEIRLCRSFERQF